MSRSELFAAFDAAITTRDRAATVVAALENTMRTCYQRRRVPKCIMRQYALAHEAYLAACNVSDSLAAEVYA